jgi:phage-related protein
MPDLGKAFVQIVPSAEGISGSITNVLSGEASIAGTESGSIFSDKLVSTIKTVVAAAGIGAAISTAIGKVGELAAFGDTIDKQSQKIGISAKAYQEWDAVLQHSGSSIGAMQSAMKKLTQEASTGSDAFQKLGISQEDALSMSQEDLFAATITGLQGMEAGTERAALAQELLGRSSQEMAALLNTSAEDTQAMKDRVNELGGVMSDDAVKAAAGYQDALQDMQTAMAGLSRGLISEFLPGFTEVMNGITNIFSGDAEGGVGQVVAGLSSIGETIVNAIPEFATHAAELVTGLANAIAEHLPELVDKGAEMVTNAATGFLNNLPEMISSAGELINQLISFLMENMPQMMEKGFEVVTNIAQGILNNLPAIVGSIAEVIASILANIGEHLPEILQKGIELLGQLLAGIIQAIPEIPGKIMEVINSIKGEFEKFDWKQIGTNLIDGIKNGITSAASKIKDAALEAAKAAFQAVKDFFGIKSPSKLMRDEIGQYIPMGIAEGIESHLGLVTDAMDDLSVAANGTIKSNVRTGAAYSAGSAAIGGVTVNVYGAPGQDERVLAEKVATIIQRQVNSRRAVFA